MSNKEKYIPTNDLLRKLKKIRNEKKIDIDPRIFNAIKDCAISKDYLLEKERNGRWIIIDVTADEEIIVACKRCKNKKIIKNLNELTEFCDKCGAHNKGRSNAAYYISMFYFPDTLKRDKIENIIENEENGKEIKNV